MKLLVDTGSIYTWISAATLQGIGAQAAERRRVLTIEGKTVEGRTLHTLCLFAEGGDLEVLGAATYRNTSASGI